MSAPTEDAVMRLREQVADDAVDFTVGVRAADLRAVLARLAECEERANRLALFARGVDSRIKNMRLRDADGFVLTIDESEYNAALCDCRDEFASDLSRLEQDMYPLMRDAAREGATHG